MRAILWRLGVGAVALTTITAVCRADVTDEEIRKSIDKAIRFLNSQQKPEGSWDEQPGYSYGVTSLATLALLNAGVPANDEHLAKALTYLRAKKPDKVYTVALQTLVFCAARHKDDMALIERNVKLLQDAQVKGGSSPGGWSYAANGSAAANDRFEAAGDNSNSQFAVWALHEADRAGAKTDAEMWKLVRKYWEGQQSVDGSWGYHPNSVSSGSMTCAGIASLRATISHTENEKADDKQAKKDDDEKKTTKQPESIEKGLDWLGRNFSVKSNPIGGGAAATLRGTDIWRMYYLNDLARVGQLTNREKMGEHKWYREGADALVGEQDRLSGSWQSGEVPHGNSIANAPNISTSFAILFLTANKAAHPGSATDSSSR